MKLVYMVILQVCMYTKERKIKTIKFYTHHKEIGILIVIHLYSNLKKDHFIVFTRALD